MCSYHLTSKHCSEHNLEYCDDESGLVEAGDTTEEIVAIMDEVTHATLGTAR